MANGAIYLPIPNPDLGAIIEEGRYDGGRFTVPIPEGDVSFNQLPSQQVGKHLQGFLGYVKQLQSDRESKTQAYDMVASSRSVLGLITDLDFDDAPTLQSLMLFIARQYNGFVFAADSIILPDGRALVGPLAQILGAGTPSRYNQKAIRDRNLQWLQAQGFKPATTLPMNDGRQKLRPLKEIAQRLSALYAMFGWVSISDERMPTPALKEFIKNNRLMEHLTEKERSVFRLDRDTAYEQNADTIGWRLENMLPLAWILGFHQHPMIQNQIEGAFRDEMLQFCPNLDQSVDVLINDSNRKEIDVMGTEDLFYCAHNAIRSAQMGGDTVPKGFHPIEQGGCIHERRHALTWAINPTCTWEETPLDT